MEIWSLAWDTDNGTGASVHLTERDAYIDMIATTTDDKDQREEAIRIYDAEQEGSDVDFWEWFDENLRGDLDTFSIESHEIELPTATATPTESSTGSIQCFNDRELATVLHGLRMAQEQITGDGDCWTRACDHFDEVEPMNDIEIDALCERLNLAPEKPQEIVISPLEVVKLADGVKH